jgi:hypothetical protein
MENSMKRSTWNSLRASKSKARRRKFGVSTEPFMDLNRLPEHGGIGLADP